MSKLKFVATLFISFAMFCTDAFAVPSVRQLGTAVQKNTDKSPTDSPVQLPNKARVATPMIAKTASSAAATTKNSKTKATIITDSSNRLPKPVSYGNNTNTNTNTPQKSQTVTYLTELNNSIQNLNNSKATKESVEKIAAAFDTDANGNLSMAYENLTGKPTIPEKTSELTNDSNFVQSTDTKYATVMGKFTNDGKLSYANLTDTPTIPEKTSELTNDSNFVQSTNEKYATVMGKFTDDGKLSYSNLTETPTIPGADDFVQKTTKVTKLLENVTDDGEIPYTKVSGTPTIPEKTSELTNDSNFVQSTNEKYATVMGKFTDDGKLSYSNLTETPTIPGADDFVQKTTKVTKLLENVTDDGEIPYNKITDTPTLSAVATSGSYADLAEKPTIPSKTSELTNDSDFVQSTDTKYATVMDKFTNDGKLSYANLTDTPTIPNTNNFVEKTEKVTKLLGNVTDDGEIPYNKITDTPTLSAVATSGSYADLAEKPTIPSKTSELTNDSDFVKSTNEKYATVMGKFTDDGKLSYSNLTDTPTIPNTNNFVEKTEKVTKLLENVTDDGEIPYTKVSGTPTIPSKTSELTNDSDFVKSTNEKYATVMGKFTDDGKLSYSNLTETPTIPSKTSELTNDSDFVKSTNEKYATVMDKFTDDGKLNTNSLNGKIDNGNLSTCKTITYNYTNGAPAFTATLPEGFDNPNNYTRASNTRGYVVETTTDPCDTTFVSTSRQIEDSCGAVYAVTQSNTSYSIHECSHQNGTTSTAGVVQTTPYYWIENVTSNSSIAIQMKQAAADASAAKSNASTVAGYFTKSGDQVYLDSSHLGNVPSSAVEFTQAQNSVFNNFASVQTTATTAASTATSVAQAVNGVDCNSVDGPCTPTAGLLEQFNTVVQAFSRAGMLTMNCTGGSCTATATARPNGGDDS